MDDLLKEYFEKNPTAIRRARLEGRQGITLLSHQCQSSLLPSSATIHSLRTSSTNSDQGKMHTSPTPTPSNTRTSARKCIAATIASTSTTEALERKPVGRRREDEEEEEEDLEVTLARIRRNAKGKRPMRGMSIADIEQLERNGNLDQDLKDLEILKPPKNQLIKIEDPNEIEDEDLRRDTKIAQFRRIMEQPMEWGTISINQQRPEVRDRHSEESLTQGHPIMQQLARPPRPRGGRTVNSRAKGRTAGDRSRHAAIDSPCDPATEVASVFWTWLKQLSKNILHESLRKETRPDDLASKDDDVGDASQWLVEQPSLEEIGRAHV